MDNRTLNIYELILLFEQNCSDLWMRAVKWKEALYLQTTVTVIEWDRIQMLLVCCDYKKDIVYPRARITFLVECCYHYRVQLQTIPGRRLLLFLNGPSTASSSFIFIFSSKNYNSYNKYVWKNVMTVQYLVSGFEPTTFRTCVSSHNH